MGRQRPWSNDYVFDAQEYYLLNRAAFLLWGQLRDDELRIALEAVLDAMKRSVRGQGEDLSAIRHFVDAFALSLATDDEVTSSGWYSDLRDRPQLYDRIRHCLFRHHDEDVPLPDGLDPLLEVNRASSSLDRIIGDVLEYQSLDQLSRDACSNYCPITMSVGADVIFALKDWVMKAQEVRIRSRLS